MLTIKYIDGRACPFVYCDACGERIKQCDDGVAQLFSDGHVRFVHRATRCDDHSDNAGCYELDVFLAYLLQNIRYHARTAKYRADLLAEAW